MAVAKVMSTGTAAASDKKDVWIPTACGMCYTNCGILVHVKDGKVIGLEGNPIHPQNRGLMCAKGKAGIMNLYNPNRVLTPLKRTNPKKGIGVDPKWVEISWDEALDTITSRLGDLKDDPQKLFLQIWEVIGDNYKWLAALAAAFGTPNVMTASSPSCGKVIHPMEFLSGGGFHQQPDLHYCKYALLVGTQIGTAARGCFNHMATDYAEARKRGMKVVVVDPISSYAGAKADEWIPIRPGTDSAFALGLMNVLVNELGIYDAPYLKKYTNAPYLVGPDGTYVRDPNLGNPLVFDSTFQKGVSYDSATPEVALEGSYQVAGVKCAPAFQVLKDHLRSFTPEKMSEITTVPAATIRRVAREFGAAAQVGATTIIKGQELPLRPACVDWARGPQGHKHGFHNCWALKLINILIGNVNMPGGILSTGAAGNTPHRWRPEAGQDGMMEHGGSFLPVPHSPAFPGRVPSQPIRQDAVELFPVAGHATTMFPLVATELEKWGLDYQLGAAIHTPGNFLLGSFGDFSVVERFYQSIPFVLGFAVEINETTEFDDIVLPFPSYLERDDFISNLQSQLPISGDDQWYWQIRQQVVPPPPGIRAPQEVIMEIARRLGVLDDMHKILNQMLMIKDPHRLEPHQSYSIKEIHDRIARSWFGEEKSLAWFQENGVLPIPRDVEECYPGPSMEARIPIYLEHYITRGRQLGEVVKKMGRSWDLSDYQALPAWMPCESFHTVGKSDYDLIAVHYKLAFVYGHYGNENPLIDEICEQNPYTYSVLMNTETGRKKGLRDGGEVWLESRVARTKARVKLTECIHPEVVGIAGHFGHWSKGMPQSRGKGVAFNSLMPYDLDHMDMISTALDHCVAVKVSRA